MIEVQIYNKNNPFPAVISENRILNKEGSAKDTRHVVVNVAGSGIRYNIGDSLGVFATNESEKVDAVLTCCGFTGDERVTLPKVEGEVRVVDALSNLDCGAILSDDDLRREGVYFDDHRFGELVFLMNPGVLIVPSHMGANAPRGMHGFTPEHPDSYAVLMSSTKLEPAPTHIKDTFTAMKSMLERE